MKTWIRRHHDHEHAGADGDRTAILLRYLYEHNEEHAKELDEVIEPLRESGRAEAAEVVAKAKEKLAEGAALLHDALHLLDGTEGE